ncbi:hypothetical protein CC85DRAFT_52982 [Cutaneotrichosporon oleaginosum]|uniref:BHLH domain-containing protein n=1 Tax=Cutaneotrichosporon oleaginosum TaxID=879819 RepID=A0A0J0XQU9_9TREE|nr:uncharacterized protein CC85DRAFT_52982 [Cutaneotrichosporon oleaginosum]KLT43447.1 hypothetical protein CC85DRAFT_52982 [Cutaneotrichosporon oleaginosum]TXT05340.1 hypothetical protein COLE_06660 [Cutaneotrichosporon oleaginosum]
MANITPPSTSPTTMPLSINVESVGMASGLSRGSTTTPTTSKPKPRKRNNNAEKRELHNATERARRETLNGRFDTLRDHVPGLRGCRRASKSAVVNGAIAALKDNRRMRILAAKIVRELSTERNELFEENNRLRQMAHLPPKAGTPNLWTDEMAQLCVVEEEPVYVAEEGDDDESDEMDLQKANIVAGNMASGLITPRSSTDLGEQPIWSASFAAPAPSIPFNFMNNSAETSSSNSPVGSSHMITPPQHTEGRSPGVALGVSPHSSSPAESPQNDVWGQFTQPMFQPSQQAHQSQQQSLQMPGPFGQAQYDLSMFLAQGGQNVPVAIAFPHQRDALATPPATAAPTAAPFDFSFSMDWLQQQQPVGV